MPFSKFPGADYRLGPEMKSTGEVMARGRQLPAGVRQGADGGRLSAADSRARVFLSVCDSDKSAATILGQRLHGLGFKILATRGTARALQSLGRPDDRVVNKVTEGEPHVVNLIEEGRGRLHRQHTVRARRPQPTATRSAPRRSNTASPASPRIAGASAAVSAIEAARRPRVAVHCLQDLHASQGD